MVYAKSLQFLFGVQVITCSHMISCNARLRIAQTNYEKEVPTEWNMMQNVIFVTEIAAWRNVGGKFSAIAS